MPEPTAPRITLDDINSAIDREYYFTAAQGVDGADIATMRGETPGGCTTLAPLNDDPDVSKTLLAPLQHLTFCVLVLKNGFTVTGESAPVSPANFDADVGKRVARENAVDKLWPLLGYELKQRLFAEGGAS